MVPLTPLLLAGCAAAPDAGPLAPGPLPPLPVQLWAEGDWYGTGRVALLLLAAEDAACADLREPDLYTSPDSPLFRQEGVLFRLVVEGLDPEATLADPDPAAPLEGDPPPWTGFHPAHALAPGERWTLDAWILHDGQASPPVPDATWLDIRSADATGASGAWSTGTYAGGFAATSCGESTLHAARRRRPAP